MKGFRLLHNFPLSQAYPGAMRSTVRTVHWDQAWPDPPKECMKAPKSKFRHRLAAVRSCPCNLCWMGCITNTRLRQPRRARSRRREAGGSPTTQIIAEHNCGERRWGPPSSAPGRNAQLLLQGSSMTNISRSIGHYGVRGRFFVVRQIDGSAAPGCMEPVV
jgi:hypothetical protein